MVNLNNIIYNKHCPICGYSIQSHFLDLGNLVDSTHVIETQDIALNLPKLPHHFCYCPQCEAIWNDSIDNSKTSFNKRLYKMYNQGKNWSELNSKSCQIIIKAVKNLINIKPENSTITIIDIGCADGYFINLIAQHILNNPNEFNTKNHTFKFLGFDLNPNDIQDDQNSYFEYHQQYFNPAQDIQKYQPDILIFKQMICYLDITFWDNLILNVTLYKQQQNSGFPIYAFISEEHFDDVFEARHYNEFYYSSYVNFPSLTFNFLIHKIGKIISIENETQNTHNAIAFIEIAEKNQHNFALNSTEKIIQNLHKANIFYTQSFEEINTIKLQLQNLYSNKKTNQQIIIWGSGARGNQFISMFQLDKQKFPIVVDSDNSKTGFYIPGTGQQISHYKQIHKNSNNIIIITAQWKANDIYHTIKQELINYDGGIYVVKNGKLLNYETIRENHF